MGLLEFAPYLGLCPSYIFVYILHSVYLTQIRSIKCNLLQSLFVFYLVMSKISENEVIIHTLTKPDTFSMALLIPEQSFITNNFSNYLFLTIGFT